jgi:putative membrane protein
VGTEFNALRLEAARNEEPNMNRRNAIALISVAAAMPSLAFAKDMEDADKDHAAQTLAVGTVALETSRLAQQKAKNAWVKKFAQYEVAEQTIIAEILKSMGAAPARMSDKQEAMIAKAKDAKAGAAFDAGYIADQIEGHNELLKIQETYISKGKNEANVNLAKLARSQIKEHIDLLQTIQKQVKA